MQTCRWCFDSYLLDEVGGGDEAAVGVDGIHLDEAICEVADHVCGVVEVAGLVLVQFGQG